MILALIAIGSFWFWTGLIALSIVEIVFVERENGRIATGVLVAGLVLVACFTDFNPFLWIIQHPFQLLMWVAVYLLAGIVWGGIRWWLFLLNAKDRYREFRAEFLNMRKIDPNQPIPEKVLNDLRRTAVRGEYKPLAIRNKARIVLWMTYWPFSAIWTMLNDPLRRFFQLVYGRLLYRYQAVSDRIFREFREDFVEPPESPAPAEPAMLHQFRQDNP